MAFTLPSFPLMNLLQASPRAAQLEKGLMAQKLAQQQIGTGFLPRELQAALALQQQQALQAKERTPYIPFEEMTGGLGRLSGLASTAASHPFLSAGLAMLRQENPEAYKKVSKSLAGFIKLPGDTDQKPQVADPKISVPGMPGVYYYKSNPNKFYRGTV